MVTGREAKAASGPKAAKAFGEAKPTGSHNGAIAVMDLAIDARLGMNELFDLD